MSGDRFKFSRGVGRKVKNRLVAKGWPASAANGAAGAVTGALSSIDVVRKLGTRRKK
jgi:hypothetical protein